MSSRIDNILIPNEDSACQSWRNYFQDLTAKYGSKNAREAWLYTWNQKGNKSCSKDKGFNKWAESNEIAVADGLDKAVAGVSGIGQNLINGIGTMTGLAPKIGAVALIGGLGITLFLLYKFAKAVKPSDVLQALPAGKATSLFKALKK